jgi:pilus assembly protein Flp/PilA
MGPTIRLLFFKLKNRFFDEDGQDLVEYALVVGMLSFAAVASMQTFATDLSNAFSQLATSFNADI